MNGDGDLFGDACDNCPLSYNLSQTNLDGDGMGDTCDPCPTVIDDGRDTDNCIETPNADRLNSDEDELRDACDNCIEQTNPVSRTPTWMTSATPVTTA